MITCLLFFFRNISLAQNTEIDTTADPQQTYQNEMSAGEFTPGKGFQIAKNKFASLNISLYGMVRYLNQMPGTDTWTDHRGKDREFRGRNDFYWHRSMIWFTGFVGTPKLTYMATVWTVFTTQQTLIYGNIKYSFNKHFTLGMGIVPNVGLRSIQGAFPFYASTDRTMGEDALRGGFTNGLFASGVIVPRLTYFAMIGNNLSNLGVTANKLTRSMSKSLGLTWLPTTGEYGPRGGLGDFEHHDKLALRFGVAGVHSRENRFNNTGTPSPDNTQVRISDGLLFFETGALADGVTVQEADYNLINFDMGFKYKGFNLQAEICDRRLTDFVADGPVPMTSMADKAYNVQALYMVVPKVLCVYGVYSGIIDQFNRNPMEIGGGVNIYPRKSRSWRVNLQGTYLKNGAGGGTFGLITAGQTGATFTFGTDFLL